MRAGRLGGDAALTVPWPKIQTEAENRYLAKQEYGPRSEVAAAILVQAAQLVHIAPAGHFAPSHLATAYAIWAAVPLAPDWFFGM